MIPDIPVLTAAKSLAPRNGLDKFEQAVAAGLMGMSDDRDHIGEMLSSGWSVAGYSNTIMAAGAMTYSVLLQKGTSLTAVTIVITNGTEMGRTVVPLSPRPPAKKGWF